MTKTITPRRISLQQRSEIRKQALARIAQRSAVRNASAKPKA